MALKGGCHCGATQFTVSKAPEQVFRCTCSFCAKRGPLWAYYEPQDFHLTTPVGNAATYRWRSRQVAHHHCPTCGCGTWSDSPAFENGRPVPGKMRVGLNARLLDDFDLDAVPVTVIDGKNLW
jgi:hypothetical protein